MDTLAPQAFHRLALARRPPERPPWDRPDRIMAWRPVLTGLFRCRWPVLEAPPDTSRSRAIVFTSPLMNTHVSAARP
jgi:hypothetical protein